MMIVNEFALYNFQNCCVEVVVVAKLFDESTNQIITPLLDVFAATVFSNGVLIPVPLILYLSGYFFCNKLWDNSILI